MLNRLFYLVGATRRIGFYLFTPKPQYNPTIGFEFFGNFFISLNIPLYLRNPKILSHFEIFFTPIPIVSVPKLAVAEHRNFFTDKRNIGMSENRFDILSVTQTFLPQCFPK